VTPSDLLEALRLVYPGPLLTEVNDVEPFVVDWRKQWTGRCLAVAQPHSVDQVAALVRWCAANGVPVVPQGGNTGLSGGATPDDSGQALVVSLTRLNQVRSVDPINNTITVDAGVLLSTVQQVAAQHNRLFPLSLAAEGSCTIGGNLATNAGGTAVLRYGNARELCLGVEVVTASGEVWNGLRGLRKDNTGYNLRDVFVGSEGTLGVITGAVLKLFPQPTAHAVALVGCRSFEAAVAVFLQARAKLDTALVGCEVLNSVCVQMVTAYSPSMRSPLAGETPWLVLLDVIDMESEQVVTTKLEAVISASLEHDDVVDAAVAQSSSQAQQFWTLREQISESQAAYGPTIKHDVSVPISALADFVARATAAIEAGFPEVQMVTFGHLGDGNLHVNLSPKPGADSDSFRSHLPGLNALVHELVRSFAGSISAEHGLGVLRRDEADRFRSAVDRQLQLAIKQSLDPQGLMNPGKLLPKLDI
jgi:FAD/FMN-containing dehydrogenase